MHDRVPPDHLREISAVRERLEAAENAGDPQAIATLFADDVVVMVPDQPVMQGRTACGAFVAATLPALLSHFDRRITYVSDEVALAGPMAFDRGTFSIAIAPRSGGEPAEVRGKYLWLLSRDADAEWKLARAIVSLDEEPRGEGDC